MLQKVHNSAPFCGVVVFLTEVRSPPRTSSAPETDSDDDWEADPDEPPFCNLSHQEVNNLNFDTAIKLAFAGFLRTAKLTCESKDLENRPVFEHTKLQRHDVDLR